MIRLIRYGAFALQLIPFAGGFIVVGLAALEHYTCRDMFRASLNEANVQRNGCEAVRGQLTDLNRNQMKFVFAFESSCDCWPTC